MIPRIVIGLAAVMICTAALAQEPSGAPNAPAKTPTILKRYNDSGTRLAKPAVAPEVSKPAILKRNNDAGRRLPKPAVVPVVPAPR
jgi:hypothetical protein